MPAKKRKYNARFPAGRIKKIMQTDEEVGKVAQAVPVIICFESTPRALELFVESLLKKSMEVTLGRHAKTLSPSHLKECILAESRFDFLKDLVKNIPDISAAEDKETSEENSPNTPRFVEGSSGAQPTTSKVYANTSAANPKTSGPEQEDSNSSDSLHPHQAAKKHKLKCEISSPNAEHNPKIPRRDSNYNTSSAYVLDLTKKNIADNQMNRRVPNFYQETLKDVNDEVAENVQRSVIRENPNVARPSVASTSTNTSHHAKPKRSYSKVEDSMNRCTREPIRRTSSVPKIDLERVAQARNSLPHNLPRLYNLKTPPITPDPSVAPLINIDFSKDITQPEIKVLNNTANVDLESLVGSKNVRKSIWHVPPTYNQAAARNVPKMDAANSQKLSGSLDKMEVPPILHSRSSDDLDRHNSGKLEIDEDYDT